MEERKGSQNAATMRKGKTGAELADVGEDVSIGERDPLRFPGRARGEEKDGSPSPLNLRADVGLHCPKAINQNVGGPGPRYRSVLLTAPNQHSRDR